MRKSKINISGFKIGTAENREGLTGVTVIWHLMAVQRPV